MKKTYLLFASFILISVTSVAQQQALFYNFEGNFTEQSGNGPELTVLGETGIFENDVLNELSGNTKMVYFFAKNNGVQFNNIAANNFIGEDYSIEIYFKFDELTSWKRVIDWKNRKTDRGAYIYSGKLNFYNILYSGEAPVVAGEYTYYVLTRTASTGKVLIYTDADVKIDFIDTNNDALVDDDGVINFFYDDLVVKNEASAGAVAMIKLYNYPLSQEEITEKWNDLGGQIYGIDKLYEQVYANVYPNPASSTAKLDLSNFRAEYDVKVEIYNMQGRLINVQQLKAGSNQIGTGFLLPGMYLLHLRQDHIFSTIRLLIQ
ncbi:MAG: T9SS type A sorting domain-containing protein [Lentimicrobiaceae bacterium]|nr:T9SS type A sorting domain-containing protein [Lentimicrobiaceae bacterium]MDD4596539.1 T9SS type A sorting domain-containing protein [Lentimicrobiaceae bacterium]MDY0026770.1 T9SS type A sorting domain-containing protein [Lentimicrobium sp.]